MAAYEGLRRPFVPDWPGLIDNILRQGTPRRAYHIELIVDREIQDAIVQRFDLLGGLKADHPDYLRRRYIAVQRFCGYDYVRIGLLGMDMPFHGMTTEDTAELKRADGRRYMDEHSGPITNWEQFETFPWPDPNAPLVTAELEWFERNLPEDTCIIGSGGLGHFAEWLTWLMGYETLCYALYDQRDLVEAIAAKIREIFRVCVKRVLQFERVKMVWGSDDMGFKTGLLISPADTRKYVLSGHKELAAMAHAAGRPYLLHACGNLADIIDDLIDDVKIDAKHSFEDTIEDVRQVKNTYGRRIAMLGGIDMDFICRGSPEAIRRRVRQTLDACNPGGGYCLGTGNTVANYVPLENYLTMLDEGRLYGT